MRILFEDKNKRRFGVLSLFDVLLVTLIIFSVASVVLSRAPDGVSLFGLVTSIWEPSADGSDGAEGNGYTGLLYTALAIITLYSIALAGIKFFPLMGRILVAAPIRWYRRVRPETLFVKKLREELNSFDTIATSNFAEGNEKGRANVAALKGFKAYQASKSYNQFKTHAERLVADEEGFERYRQMDGDFAKIIEQAANAAQDAPNKEEILADNDVIWQPNWDVWKSCDSNLREVRELPVSTAKFFDERVRNLKKLAIDTGYQEKKRNKKSKQPADENRKRLTTKIEFRVASIQPSIMLAARRVHRLVGSPEEIELVFSTTTGPQTVSEAVHAYDCGRETVQLFAAPLAAFVTSKALKEFELRTEVESPAETQKKTIKSFVPISALVEETQSVLFLQNRNSINPDRANIWYYNNSTAEECLAVLNDKIVKGFEAKTTADYKNYTSLLNGDTGFVDELRPGDGIAVWPPLTDIYRNAPLGDGVLTFGEDEMALHSRSQIMLFASKNFEDCDNAEAVARFLKALLFEMREVQETYRLNRPWKWVRLTAHHAEKRWQPLSILPLKRVYSRWIDSSKLIRNFGRMYGKGM